MTEFLSYLTNVRRLSPHTVNAYRLDLETFKGQLIKSEVRSWLAGMVTQGLSAQTIHRRAAALRAHISWLRKQGQDFEDPFKGLTLPKIGEKVRESIPESALRDLLLSMPEGRPKHILQVLYGTGMRISELAGLQVSDFDSSRNVITVVGKGSKTRFIPVMPEVKAGLEALLGTDLTQSEIRSSVGKWLKLISTHTNPHILRHSFATHLLNNGANMVAIKDLLGHSSIATTQIYAKSSPEHLRQNHNLLGR